MQLKIRVPYKRLGKITLSSLASLSFVLYFSSLLVKLFVGKALSFVDARSMINVCASLVIYFPLLLLCLITRSKAVPLDAVFLWVGIVSFFFVSLLFHPEYQYWYSDPDFGVINYVMIPTEGIYAYLFVRLIKDPKKLKELFKLSGWLMYIYFAYWILDSTRRGGWTGVSASGFVEASYSVSFGYNVLFFALPFLYDALIYKKSKDIAGAVLGLYMVIVYGSRGPLLCVGIFAILFVMIHLNRSRKKWLIIALMCVGFACLYVLYLPILIFISNVLESFGGSSRFVSKLLDGTLTEDNGRMQMWQAALGMIKENPFGHGAMGSKPVLTQYIYAGYPHSVVLEILIDFGIFVGGMILLFLFWNAYQMLFNSKNRDWLPVFLPIFATACQLLISLCYWSSPAFWASIAVGVNSYFDHKRMRRKQIQGFQNTSGN